MSAVQSRAEQERIVWHGLRTLLLDGNDRRRDVSEALGMSFVRVKALRFLVDGPLTMRELAGELATDSPYTTLVVDDLEARELVVRSQHPDDRRVKVVTLTAPGRRAARKAERILGTPPAVFARLSEQEFAQLHGLIARLV